MDDPGTRRQRIPAWVWVTLAVLVAGAAAAFGNALLLRGVDRQDPVGRLSPRMAGIAAAGSTVTGAEPEPPLATTVAPGTTTGPATTRTGGDDHHGGDGDDDD